MLLIILAALIFGVGYVAFRVSKTFPPSQRVIFWIVVILGLAYVVPQVARGLTAGFATGTDERRQQGR